MALSIPPTSTMPLPSTIIAANAVTTDTTAAPPATRSNGVVSGMGFKKPARVHVYTQVSAQKKRSHWRDSRLECALGIHTLCTYLCPFRDRAVIPLPRESRRLQFRHRHSWWSNRRRKNERRGSSLYHRAPVVAVDAPELSPQRGDLFQDRERRKFAKIGKYVVGRSRLTVTTLMEPKQLALLGRDGQADGFLRSAPKLPKAGSMVLYSFIDKRNYEERPLPPQQGRTSGAYTQWQSFQPQKLVSMSLLPRSQWYLWCWGPCMLVLWFLLERCCQSPQCGEEGDCGVHQGGTT